MTHWAEVHCMVCDKSFAVNWEYLEEDGCFVKAGKEASMFCPYCRAEALFAGESVDDDDYDYDEEEDEDLDTAYPETARYVKGPIEEYP